MEFDTLIRGRRSIRKYKPEPVPHELIREILDEGRWSPSWANTQAWNIYVVTGETLERLRGARKDPTQSQDQTSPDFRVPQEWPPHLAERTKQLLDCLKPDAPGNAPAPAPTALTKFFGAPCLLLFAVERGVTADYALFDSGLIVQSVCLAAHNKGLGTCIMAMAGRDPDTLREILPGAADMQFVIGVALGYPDEEATINRFERSRVPLEELVSWAE